MQGVEVKMHILLTKEEFHTCTSHTFLPPRQNWKENMPPQPFQHAEKNLLHLLHMAVIPNSSRFLLLNCGAGATRFKPPLVKPASPNLPRPVPLCWAPKTGTAKDICSPKKTTGRRTRESHSCCCAAVSNRTAHLNAWLANISITSKMLKENKIAINS